MLSRMLESMSQLMKQLPELIQLVTDNVGTSVIFTMQNDMFEISKYTNPLDSDSI